MQHTNESYLLVSGAIDCFFSELIFTSYQKAQSPSSKKIMAQFHFFLGKHSTKKLH